MKLEDITFTVRESLVQANVPAEAIKQVLADLEKVAKEEKESRAGKSKSKTQYVVLLDDAENQFEGRAFLGWVVQMEDSAVPMAALDRAKAAGRAYNESLHKKRRGKRTPVKTIREVFAGVPRKFWKDEVVTHKTAPKTKEPVLIQPVKGEL
jgi:hypothetical protein